MNAVHARRDEGFVQKPLEADRQPHIAMMEECVGLQDQLIYGKCRHRNPDEQHLHDTKSRGHPHLAKMKPKSGGNIEVRIDVMHIMEAPEKSDAVICDVPP